MTKMVRESRSSGESAGSGVRLRDRDRSPPPPIRPKRPLGGPSPKRSPLLRRPLRGERERDRRRDPPRSPRGDRLRRLLPRSPLIKI